MGQRYAVIDIETTGLDPDRDAIFEVAVIVGEVGRRPLVYTASLPIDETHLSGRPLEIYRAHAAKRPPRRTAHDVAEAVARLTAGAVVVGNNPAFDRRFLDRLLQSQGVTPTWHYQLDDVEARAAQHLNAGPPPWRSEDLSRGLGVDPSDFDRHSAAGDARWSLRQYERLTGLDLGERVLGSLGLSSQSLAGVG